MRFIELFVLRAINHRIANGGDVPALRRYFNALVETSLPTVGLAAHMSQMGPERALASLMVDRSGHRTAQP